MRIRDDNIEYNSKDTLTKNDMALKVMMMGGRRCGKTSALASIFYEIIHGTVKNHLTIADRTVLATKTSKRGVTESQESLNGKTLELKDFFPNEPTEKTFLVDKNPTNNFWTYKLGLKLPGTASENEMVMEFLDCAGEFFESGTAEASHVEEYVKNCDVFIVVVDTPYLMGVRDEAHKNICREAVNLGTNRVNDIHNFLTNIDDKQGKDAKMVIFVPIKCEKWEKEGRMDEVVTAIEQTYHTTITALTQYSMINVAIIPILTAGNIIFEEFKEASILTKKNQPKKTFRCCQISSKMVRMEDGTPYRLKEGDIVNPDSEAVISGTDIVRPYAWYRLNQDPNDFSYHPQYCEQLPLHILLFALRKYKWNKEHPTSIFDWLKIKFGEMFGRINIPALEKTMHEMAPEIKGSDVNIKYLKRSL